MSISQLRIGQGGGCEFRSNVINEEFIASQDYTNMYDWFTANNIGSVIQTSGVQEPNTGGDAVQNVYINTPATGSSVLPFNNTDSTQSKNLSFWRQSQIDLDSTATSPLTTNYYRWYQQSNGDIYLMVSGTRCCGGDADGDSSVRVSFTVYRRDSVVVFETEPQEALPDVWYENNESFSIDSSGNHSGNVTNQNISTGVAGVVNTGFLIVMLLVMGLKVIK